MDSIVKRLFVIAVFAFGLHSYLFAQNKVVLSFNGMPSLKAQDGSVQIQKFSDYLKVTASGTASFEGKNVPFSLSLTCPKFNFINGHQNRYHNASNYFLDARADAILSVTIDTLTYGNAYRSKDPTNVISHVSTTDYGIYASNVKAINGQDYLIEVSIVPGTILKQSSETLPAGEVKSITVSKGSFTIVNPQPAQPKVKSSFTEVTGKTGK